MIRGMIMSCFKRLSKVLISLNFELKLLLCDGRLVLSGPPQNSIASICRILGFFSLFAFCFPLLSGCEARGGGLGRVTLKEVLKEEEEVL